MSIGVPNGIQVSESSAPGLFLSPREALHRTLISTTRLHVREKDALELFN